MSSSGGHERTRPPRSLNDLIRQSTPTGPAGPLYVAGIDPAVGESVTDARIVWRDSEGTLVDAGVITNSLTPLQRAALEQGVQNSRIISGMRQAGNRSFYQAIREVYRQAAAQMGVSPNLLAGTVAHQNLESQVNVDMEAVHEAFAAVEAADHVHYEVGTHDGQTMRIRGTTANAITVDDVAEISNEVLDMVNNGFLSTHGVGEYEEASHQSASGDAPPAANEGGQTLPRSPAYFQGAHARRAGIGRVRNPYRANLASISDPRPAPNNHQSFADWNEGWDDENTAWSDAPPATSEVVRSQGATAEQVINDYGAGLLNTRNAPVEPLILHDDATRERIIHQLQEEGIVPVGPVPVQNITVSRSNNLQARPIGQLGVVDYTSGVITTDVRVNDQPVARTFVAEGHLDAVRGGGGYVPGSTPVEPVPVDEMPRLVLTGTEIIRDPNGESCFTVPDLIEFVHVGRRITMNGRRARVIRIEGPQPHSSTTRVWLRWTEQEGSRDVNIDSIPIRPPQVEGQPALDWRVGIVANEQPPISNYLDENNTTSMVFGRNRRQIDAWNSPQVERSSEGHLVTTNATGNKFISLSNVLVAENTYRSDKYRKWEAWMPGSRFVGVGRKATSAVRDLWEQIVRYENAMARREVYRMEGTFSVTYTVVPFDYRVNAEANARDATLSLDTKSTANTNQTRVRRNIE